MPYLSYDLALTVRNALVLLKSPRPNAAAYDELLRQTIHDLKWFRDNHEAALREVGQPKSKRR